MKIQNLTATECEEISVKKYALRNLDILARLIEKDDLPPMPDWFWGAQFNSWWRWLCWFYHRWVDFVDPKTGMPISPRLCCRCGIWGWKLLVEK